MRCVDYLWFDFFFNYTATTEIYPYLHTLSLHDAFPITASIHTAPSARRGRQVARRETCRPAMGAPYASGARRSEEHTSELQSLMRISYAVFCLKKKITRQQS